MTISIPNDRPVGNDLCSDPVEVEVPLIIVDDGFNCHWYPDPMDEAAADRMAFTLRQKSSGWGFKVKARIVLPAACDIRSLVADCDLGDVESDPVRVRLKFDDSQP